MNGLKELAEACGFTKTHTGEVQLWLCNVGDLERFAKLVAAKEREACAKLVEESSLPDAYSEACLPEIANDIRARS